MDLNYRFFFFLGGLLTFSGLEFFFSYRKRELSRKSRWPHNVLIIVIGSLLSKITVPLGLAQISQWCSNNSYGLFNQLSVESNVEIFISIIILDFSIYWQHLVFHKFKWLWKLHRVHHSDIDLDTTSALRFHPLEILISLFYKIILVITLGLSINSIFVFEILLNFMAMFNHSNIHIPNKIEKLLRLIIVTPQMHIIHHSVEQSESDTNYGFNFSIWDKIFNSYSSLFKSKGVIGQGQFRTTADHKIKELLKQPFL